MGLNKIQLSVAAAGILIIFINLLFGLPGYIHADSNTETNVTICDSEFTSENPFTPSKPASPEPGAYFYPVIITSVVVLGILIFAMWQTFRTRRHY